MTGVISKVVIVGGGTAGWLSACLLAARLPRLNVVLVESPDIPTIGVGEGTWPTMRETLATIGIDEAEFLQSCDASFKQGSRFDGWSTGAPGDSYYHPFTLPPPGDASDLLAAWRASAAKMPFAAAVTAQTAVCDHQLAPRQRAMPDYAGALNYGYHLDAGKFAALLARHATGRLGVSRVAGTLTSTRPTANGNIAAITLADGSEIAGDLFIDCSGQAAVLIEGHCQVPWIDRSAFSLNDRALAVQVPVEPGSPVASVTVGTAHEAGWLWDIALPHRRGIGCVFSSAHLAEDRAYEILSDYLSRECPEIDLAALSPRMLAFRTGHRARFWHGNCIAVGQAAGFIEPLEASAIVMIELSLRMLTGAFPASSTTMAIHAERFNALFDYRWDRIVEFLKLHYVLSRRPQPYWLAQRAAETIPQRLADNLQLWRDHPPSARDFPDVEEIFPAASQQYVLYGMNFPAPPATEPPTTAALARLTEVHERGRALLAGLPSNRTYFAGPLPAQNRTVNS